MASSNQSPDPAAQLLSVNRNQTVPATGVATGQPITIQGSVLSGGYVPGSAPGVGPESGQTPSGASGNLANVSAGSPSGAGQPGLSAGVNNNSGISGSPSTYQTPPGGSTNQTDSPNGGQNGVTPSNAWELVSRTV